MMLIAYIKNNKRKIFVDLISFMVLFVIFSPIVTFGEEQIKSPLGNTDLKQLLVTFIEKVIIRIGSIIAVLYLIYSGYLFVEARGNPGKIDKARETFTWTLVGIAILLGAQAIAMIVTNTIESVSGGGIRVRP